MTKLRVLLVQLPVPNNAALNTPLAAGYLKAYAAAQGLDAAAGIELLPRQLADRAGDALLVDAIVASRPDVLGVSLYTWNSERSLALAARVKARMPGLRVVVGGPEVQRDNAWVLEHPAVDVAVIGEGEQTFAELLRLWSAGTRHATHIPLVHAGGGLYSMDSTEDGGRETNARCLPSSVFRSEPLEAIAGIAYHHGDTIRFTAERVALSDLSAIPSPYLAGYLDVPADGMLMVEVSRWCPYSCSFCLYGRNMGARLGNRYFGLERVLDEIRWGRERGIGRVHFVEANLNLVPLFRPLMAALADLNADGAQALYAELRGEHLGDEAVSALAQAGLRVAEVGLQTANPAALRIAHRRTDLRKWAAGTRRLAGRGVEIYLDVILGLPGDDAAGVAETLDFIRREGLGPYDVFTLQVLPGTATRDQAAEYGLVYQDRPPYYVLATDRLSYAELRRLRRELKLGAGLDPDEVEGCPPPRLDALSNARPTTKDQVQLTSDGQQAKADHARNEPPAWSPGHQVALSRLWLLDAGATDWESASSAIDRLSSHVDVVARWEDAAALGDLLARAIAENPTTLLDCYLLADASPPENLRAWRAALLYQPGYLDRVAVYRRAAEANAGAPAPAHDRVSPRLWLVLPWSAQADPQAYQGIAEVIWIYDMAPGEEPPLSAWSAAGGAGVWVRGRSEAEIAAWRERADVRLWG